MESVRGVTNKDSELKQLQENLFPVVAKPKQVYQPGGFFMNLIIKPNPLLEDDNTQDEGKKELKDVFSVIREPSSTLQPARWPTECQVLEEKVKHIYYTPPAPEVYYALTGKEPQPKPVGDDLGIIIYQYYPISAVNYFSKSSVGGSRYLLPTCPSPEENSLRFDSRFECGNLAKAIKITANYYELYLRTDLYTNKHMQWFYFRVKNMKKNMLYRFSIVNMTKDESLYNEGMRPLLYSDKDALLHSIGWRRCGKNITYFCNENAGPDDPDQLMTFTLTFTLEFPHDDDVVYIAYSYPYTYTELQDYLIDLCKHPIKSTYTTLRLLCKTLAGNNVYYLTVTAAQEHHEAKKKRAIVITARVHPSETPASWMMKGIMDFITGDSGPAKELREKFIFKLVPMLNPDGVIVGNTRCSLAGKDLNRQYRTVIRETYPSIWYTKLMIRRLLEECGVAMYCDLHAHSRKHNIFVYGCETKKGPDNQLGEQVFPLMLHKNAADKFSFEDCKFRVQRCKEGTGRVVMWMMGISNSYTIEASLAGSMLGSKAETHFSVQDYEQMGRSVCQTLLDFYDEDPRKERLRVKIKERLFREGSNADEPTNIPLSDYSSDVGDTSDSSSDEACHKEYIPLIVPPSSPALPNRMEGKPIKIHNKLRIQNQSTIQPKRKTLTLFTANLDLDVSQKNFKYISSYSSSVSDSESTHLRRKKKVLRKRRSIRRTTSKLQITARRNSQRHKSPSGITVVDISPDNKIRSRSWHQLSSTSLAPKVLSEPKRTQTVTQQLSEVQVKLLSLKNRLWLGTGDADLTRPLSWGVSKMSESTQCEIQKSEDRKPLKKKEDRKSKKKLKSKEPTKEKATKKKQNGLRRQAAVEWSYMELNKIRKSTSLPDITTSKVKIQSDEKQGCQDAKEKPKKKKKKSKTCIKPNALCRIDGLVRKD